MNRRNLIAGALTILSASVITRIFGFIFRIYLSNRLGAEGMGLYQLVLSLYMLVVTFATSGIGIAVSRMTAEQLEINRYGGTRAILKTSIKYSLFVSALASLLLFAFASPIAIYILNDKRTILSLRCLAPSLPFMAVSCCIKGYFYALRNSFKPSAATVIEQTAKMIFIMAIIGTWLPFGDAFACAAAVLGMTVGEIVSCAYVVTAYYTDKSRKFQQNGRQKFILREIISISAPIQTSSTFHSLLRLAENLLIISGLKTFSGGDSAVAIAGYGILKGMVIPLLMFPTSFLQAIITVLIPEVAGANACGNKKAVNRAVCNTLQLTLLMGVAITGVLFLFPQQIGDILYNDPAVGTMIKKLCLICPLMYIEMVSVGILNAIGEQISPMRYNIADSLLRICLIYLFVPTGGMDTFLLIMIGSNLFTSLLNLRRLLKVTQISFKWFDWLVKPGLAVAAATIPANFIQIIISGSSPLWLSVSIASVVCAGCYFLLLFPLGCISGKDLQWIGNSFRRREKC